MQEKEIKFSVQVYKGADELSAEDAALVARAKEALVNAYAPYSNFKVGAAVLLSNGDVVTGTNQENASFPVGICAEGTALSAASSLYPDAAVVAIAVTAKSGNQVLNKPVAPCGVCRQRILEYETRYKQDIKVIMIGEEGEVYKVSTVKDLLPLFFSNSDL